MGYPFPPDVEKLAKDLMAAGDYVSEDDLLRDALSAFQESHQAVQEADPVVVAGIRRGLEDMKQGRGRSYDEFDKEFRAKHGIPGNE